MYNLKYIKNIKKKYKFKKMLNTEEKEKIQKETKLFLGIVLKVKKSRVTVFLCNYYPKVGLVKLQLKNIKRDQCQTKTICASFGGRWKVK